MSDRFYSDYEYITIEHEGYTYDVTVFVTQICEKKGTYSLMAEDPEEYYGVWSTCAEVEGAEVYDATDDDDMGKWVDVTELPAVVVYEAIDAFAD